MEREVSTHMSLKNEQGAAVRVAKERIQIKMCLGFKILAEIFANRYLPTKISQGTFNAEILDITWQRLYL